MSWWPAHTTAPLARHRPPSGCSCMADDRGNDHQRHRVVTPPHRCWPPPTGRAPPYTRPPSQLEPLLAPAPPTSPHRLSPSRLPHLPTRAATSVHPPLLSSGSASPPLGLTRVGPTRSVDDVAGDNDENIPKRWHRRRKSGGGGDDPLCAATVGHYAVRRRGAQRREKGEERRKKGGGACKGKIDIS